MIISNIDYKMNILSIENLSKQFVSTKALDDVSFSVEKGSICGLLGPNGAGKTTLLRIINNILLADSGSVKVKGEDVSYSTSRYFGYMPEERGLYDKMKVENQIMYFGRLKGASRETIRKNMEEYLQLFNLYDDRKRMVKELSKGNQQKVQIIATLVHEPDIVVLDEPFSGFDPINGALLQELISRLQSRGTTILLSSHNMAAVEEMCNDIVLINKGHLLLSGKIDDIKESHKDGSLIVTTRNPLQQDFLKSSGIITEIKETATPSHRKGHSYRLKKRPDVANYDIIKEVAYQGDIIHFEEALPNLNELFLLYTSTNQES